MSAWHTANRAWLEATALATVASERGDTVSAASHRAAAQALATAMESVPALTRLATLLRLAPLECDILARCAAIELHGDVVPPTFMALAQWLPAHAVWDAAVPSAPLRYWRLVEPAPGPELMRAPLHLDERILHFLLGVQYPDERLEAFVRPLHGPAACAWPDAAARIVDVVRADGAIPVIALHGLSPAPLADIAASACARAGLHAFALATADLPPSPSERLALARLWERESLLTSSALVITADESLPSALLALIDRLAGPTIICTHWQIPLPLARAVRRIGLTVPAADVQVAAWTHAFDRHGLSVNGAAHAFASQFHLAPDVIDACVDAAAGGDDANAVVARTWDECRAMGRVRLDELAERIEPRATWDDLVLPDAELGTLRQLVAHARQRHRVHEQWGFAARGTRGLGTSAIFAGPSGTGKTFATEVLAAELRLDLYRVDLSRVVSKYIGETEKNLRRIFDAAESGGAVLLFDEADALFGRRSEVKDSHDRYANLEVSFLLQQMETYRGLAVLTTNLPDAIDRAFLRRVRFLVRFPFPDHTQRTAIWARAFPEATPRESLDLRKLARLHMAGGNIRNIALNAAFLAADAQEPVRMTHVRAAAISECAKLDAPVSDDDVRDWC